MGLWLYWYSYIFFTEIFWKDEMKYHNPKMRLFLPCVIRQLGHQVSGVTVWILYPMSDAQGFWGFQGNPVATISPQTEILCLLFWYRSIYEALIWIGFWLLFWKFWKWWVVLRVGRISTERPCVPDGGESKMRPLIWNCFYKSAINWFEGIDWFWKMVKHLSVISVCYFERVLHFWLVAYF